MIQGRKAVMQPKHVTSRVKKCRVEQKNTKHRIKHMYTTINFKTKKQLKEAVASGWQIGIFQPNDMFGNPKADPGYSGSATVEGPHYPKPHRWYAQVEMKDGVVVSVK